MASEAFEKWWGGGPPDEGGLYEVALDGYQAAVRDCAEEVEAAGCAGTESCPAGHYGEHHSPCPQALAARLRRLA